MTSKSLSAVAVVALALFCSAIPKKRPASNTTTATSLMTIATE